MFSILINTNICIIMVTDFILHLVKVKPEQCTLNKILLYYYFVFKYIFMCSITFIIYFVCFIMKITEPYQDILIHEAGIYILFSIKIR